MTVPLIVVEMRRKGREGARRRKIHERKGKRAVLAVVHQVTPQVSQVATRPASQVGKEKIKRNQRRQKLNTVLKLVVNHQPLANLMSL